MQGVGQGGTLTPGLLVVAGSSAACGPRAKERAMIRSVIAVIASYIAMAIVVLALFSGMWFGLGPDRLLKPGSYQGSIVITILAPSITIIAGLFGGWMCAKIARGTKPVLVLAGIVVVLGGLLAAFTLQKPYPADPRPEGMTVQQIMEIGREPTWFAIANPIIGAAAILLGGMCLGAPKKTA